MVVLHLTPGGILSAEYSRLIKAVSWEREPESCPAFPIPDM